MPDFCFRSPDAETTHRAARRLGECAPVAGLVVGLVGPLGAGKTAFVKGLGEGLGLDPAAIGSPTFVIAGEYPPGRPGAPTLVHADLYRVESEAELEAAGWLDWLEPGVLLAVEWSDRFEDALPRERLEIRLERGPGGPVRTIAVRAVGPGPEACAARWREALAADGIACGPEGSRGAGEPGDTDPEPDLGPEAGAERSCR